MSQGDINGPLVLSPANPFDVLCKRIHQMSYDEKKFLLGNVLTVIDSAISDREQRKALKDVVETVWYQKNYFWYLESLLNEFRKEFTKISEFETYKIEYKDKTCQEVSSGGSFKNCK
jgi:hypothetical protein